jgi:hypothetical protein
MFAFAKNLTLAAALLAPAAALAPAHAQSVTLADLFTNTFTISNESDYRIDHVYFVPTKNTSWGGDKLIGYMQPNQHLNLRAYDGNYSVYFINSAGSGCVLTNIDLYNHVTMHVDNHVMSTCKSVVFTSATE